MRVTVTLLIALLLFGLANSSAATSCSTQDVSLQPSCSPPVESHNIAHFMTPSGQPDLEAIRASGYEGPLDVSGFDGCDRGLFERNSCCSADDGATHSVSAPIPTLERDDRIAGDENWSDKFGEPYPTIGPNGWIDCAAVYDGALILGGHITVVEGKPISNIVRWDGREWTPLGAGIRGYRVRALTVYNGDLVAGGQFTVAGEDTVGYIARWDGIQWRPLGEGLDSHVYALTVYNGDLIAGGLFARAGGSPAECIARWDGTQWYPLGSGLDDAVLSLGSFAGELIAGGWFTHSGSREVRHIARWDGLQWFSLGGGLGELDRYDSASALLEQDAALFVGGVFTTAGGVPARNIARWDGAAWSPLGAGLERLVSDLTVFDGDLIVCGSFHGDDRDLIHIARWDGADWLPLGTGLGDPDSYDQCIALTVFQDALIAGGDFDIAGGVWVGNVAQWNGIRWKRVGNIAPPGGGLNSPAFALCSYDGMLVAGGHFNNAGGTRCNNIAAWDGTRWQSQGSGITSETCYINVGALITHNGMLVAGGSCVNDQGSACGFVATWDGSTWTRLGSGFDDRVYALADYNGELIAGGQFDHAGVPACRIARWDGEAWSELGGGIILSEEPY